MNKWTWTKKNTIEFISCMAVVAVIEGTLSFCKAILEKKYEKAAQETMDLANEVTKD